MTPEAARRAHPVVACAHGLDSSGAVQLGVLLAAALHQPLVLAAAYRYEPVGLGASPLPSPLNEVRFEAAVSQIERAERLLPRGLDVEERPVPAESVPEALAELALEVDAALLVLGRDIGGHVTREVIGAASCPVAVSPFTVPVPEAEPPTAIGVAYDGSPSARCAMAAAVALAAATAGAVRVLAVGTGAGDAERRAAELAKARAVPVTVERLSGGPVDRLVQASDGLDLLACGSRGRGRIAAAVLGSVSTALVRGAHCAVLVVPPGVRQHAGTPLGLSTAAS